MPKIGIVCDDFKVEKFKEELSKAGINFTYTPFTKGTTSFICISEQAIVKPIVDQVTQYFIDRAKKRN